VPTLAASPTESDASHALHNLYIEIYKRCNNGVTGEKCEQKSSSNKKNNTGEEGRELKRMDVEHANHLSLTRLLHAYSPWQEGTQENGCRITWGKGGKDKAVIIHFKEPKRALKTTSRNEDNVWVVTELTRTDHWNKDPVFHRGSRLLSFFRAGGVGIYLNIII
jgi:hypothetical protein